MGRIKNTKVHSKDINISGLNVKVNLPWNIQTFIGLDKPLYVSSLGREINQVVVSTSFNNDDTFSERPGDTLVFAAENENAINTEESLSLKGIYGVAHRNVSFMEMMKIHKQLAQIIVNQY